MASSNGGVPPGFRFHPTDEELLEHYLKKKVRCEKLEMEVIREVDLNKMEPWELQERCKIGSAAQSEWYLFSHKDRKYPTGSRTNRATNAGFWKATGRDKCIRSSLTKIGMRKTLVFYRGRAPHGHKTDWIMHEYRLEGPDPDPHPQEDGWVVCRVFRKKNSFKAGNNSDAGGGSGQHPVSMSQDQCAQTYSHMMPPAPTFLMAPSPLALGAAAYHHHYPSLDSALVPMMHVKQHRHPNASYDPLDVATENHDWGMADDDADSSKGLGLGFELEQQGASNTLNQIPLRTGCEMDFWGYSK